MRVAGIYWTRIVGPIVGLAGFFLFLRWGGGVRGAVLGLCAFIAACWWGEYTWLKVLRILENEAAAPADGSGPVIEATAIEQMAAIEPSRRPVSLFFDVFGTLVDFRSSIAAEARRRFGDQFDGEAFADAWRAEYQPAMQTIRSGERGYVKLDVLHAENLDRILPRFGLAHLSAEERASLNLIWHRLDGWEDVAPALRRLRHVVYLAPMSNGNIALMADMARHNGWRWDAICGADLAQDYKPKLSVYRAACAAFSLDPSQCMMVAAHTDDLVAAAEAGMMTAHIARPNEHGPGKGEAGPAAPVDYAARDLAHLADLLGCPG